LHAEQGKQLLRLLNNLGPMVGELVRLEEQMALTLMVIAVQSQQLIQLTTTRRWTST